MLKLVLRPSLAALASVFLIHGADAQNVWSTQDQSGCSDQFGNFDAFVPGMRGSGACNRGGFVPGTNVIVVTNLNSSGSGSLEAATSAACPKVILFGVSGLIRMSGSINTARCDDWSIVGASAPGNVTVAGSVGGVVQVRGSNWTIDNLTIAAGDNSVTPGDVGNRDSIQWIDNNSPSSNGILMNSNLIWGADETVQCYPQPGGRTDDILFWQDIIGKPVGGSGVHIIQDTCRFSNTIRTFYIHGRGRHPLVRGEGYFHANNFTANPGDETVQIRPCTGAYAAQPSTARYEVVNNFLVHGQNSNENREQVAVTSDTSCTNLQVYENGNQTMNDNNSIRNCSNHACAEGISSNEFASSPITAIWPTGYVPETVPSSQQGLVNFATLITSYAGQRPNDRLPYFDSLISQGINMVDGSGAEGGNGNGGSSDFTSVSAEGGLSVITPPSSSYDPTDGNVNPCGENMPTGSAASAIQSSGLTRLHEWVIGCFYDNVMPAGYREDKLQNYGAPDGGGSQLPAARPNPPTMDN